MIREYRKYINLYEDAGMSIDDDNDNNNEVNDEQGENFIPVEPLIIPPDNDNGDKKTVQQDNTDEEQRVQNQVPSHDQPQDIIRSQEKKSVIMKLRMTTRLKKIFQTLTKVKKSEEIANKFIKNIRELDTEISFLDMVDDNDKLSFLSKNRLVNLERIKNEKTGKMMYGAYKTHLRQQTRIGRVINRIFPGEFTKKQVEDFTNEYKAEHDMINGNIGIRVVRGKDIAYWYDYKKYARGGTLNNSCMRAVGPKRLALYTENPEVIGLAIYTRHDKLEARALVWTLNTPRGATYMDRVYYTKDHFANAFQAYAEKNGWTTYKGRYGEGNKRMVVKLPHFKRSFMTNHPYLDTFRVNNDGTLTAGR